MKKIEIKIEIEKKTFFIFLLGILIILSGFFLVKTVNATLTCSVAGSCANVTLLKMYATDNSHAGSSTVSIYTNLVCCADATAGLSNNCSGTYAPVGTLSSANNAHYEDWLKTNYSSANDFCLSVTSGTITVSTSTDCGVNATVFSFSGTSGTNAHVGDGTAYTTKVCATTTPAAVISITLDRASFSYGTMNNNTSSSTLTLWTGAGIIATNGTAVAKFYIYGKNTAAWALATATSTENIYAHRFCNKTDNDCTTPWANYTPMTTSPTTLLKSGVLAGATVAFQLQMHTPNPSTVYTAQSAEVTVLATE
jgi:hypothetical protein